MHSSWTHIATPRAEQEEPLTKKQRENRAKAAKRKELKVIADALQAERLRKHRRELEQERIKELYAKKHSSSQQQQQGPTTKKTLPHTAGVNEYGQLIWD